MKYEYKAIKDIPNHTDLGWHHGQEARGAKMLPLSS